MLKCLYISVKNPARQSGIHPKDHCGKRNHPFVFWHSFDIWALTFDIN